MSSSVIKVENLSKQYRLGKIGTGSFAHDINRWWYSIRGKEDPYLKVGETNDRTQKGNSDFVWSLRDINFEIKQGDAVGIIGRNGAGKSTLLKILSRTTTPTTGKIGIKGRVASLLEVGTGFHPELTGRENIYLNGAILGMTKAEINRKFDEIVDFAGVERYIDTPVKRYSSGMYVRLAFGVAAHLEPEILIVDEVLAVGDAEFQKKALGKMQDVSKGEGRTVLFVSHNMAAIQRLCSQGIFLKNGRLEALGEINSVCNTYLTSTNSSELISAERTFKIDENKIFQITRITLSNEQGEIRETYEAEEAIIISIKCIVRQKVPKMYGYFLIKTKEEIPVWVSDSNDVTLNKLDDLELGENIIQLRIPERSLGVGVYRFTLTFNSNFNIGGFEIDRAEDCCEFIINDNKTIRGNNRQGYFSSLLDWSVLK